MSANEAAPGPAGSLEGRGHSGGGGDEHSPLQARAAFIKNRGWESVVSFNRGACARGGAQHGLNSESGAACAEEWERARPAEVTYLEFLDFLKAFHRRAPFLFFNGNTFADISRQITAVIFAEAPASRRREIISAAAHYVAGVLDRNAMIVIIEGMWRVAQLSPGQRVKTLRSTLRGFVVRVLEDGRVAWRPDGPAADLVALSETLVSEDIEG
jgi:hypothetical protein